MKNEKVQKSVNKLKSFLHSDELMIEDNFYLEFNSEGELTVKGCKDIDEYTDENILIVADCYYVNVKGIDLFMKKFSIRYTVVSGKIESINFIKR